MDTVISIVTGFIGSLAIAYKFNLKGKQLILSSAGGLITWAVYLAIEALLKQSNIFIPCFVATIVGAGYIDLISHRLRTPMMVIILPTLIPLFPGSSLYYTFYYFCQRDWNTMFSYAASTFTFVLAISLGIVAIKIIKDFRKTVQKERKAKAAK